jgi:hypothetical protein
MTKIMPLGTTVPIPKIKANTTNHNNTPIPVGKNTEKKEPAKEHPYAESKVHYVELKISDKQDQLLLTNDSAKKAAIQKEIATLKEKQQIQKELAKVTATPDGNIQMEILEDLTAGALKEHFDMRPGSLKENSSLKLSPTMGKDVSGVTVQDFDKAPIDKGTKIIVPPSDINHKGFVQEFIDKIRLGN